MTRRTPYHEACRIVRSIGMDVEDGLAFTFSGANYPAAVRNMNGWAVEDVVRAFGEKSNDAEASR